MNSVTVLDRDQDWHKRGIREAICIRVNKLDLNQDQGRALLPHIWDQLLQSRVSKFKKNHDSVTAVIVIKVLVRTESLTLLKKIIALFSKV